MFIKYYCPNCQNELFEIESLADDVKIKNNKSFLLKEVDFNGGDYDGGGPTDLEGHCSSCQQEINIYMTSYSQRSSGDCYINGLSIDDIIQQVVQKESDTFTTNWKGVLVQNKEMIYHSFKHFENYPATEQMVFGSFDELNYSTTKKEKDVSVFIKYALIDDTNAFVNVENDYYEVIISKSTKERENVDYYFTFMKPRIDEEKSIQFKDSFIINGIEMNHITCMVDKNDNGFDFYQEEKFYFKADKNTISFEDFTLKINQFIETLKEGQNQYDCL